jgi:hypothetical protein
MQRVRRNVRGLNQKLKRRSHLLCALSCARVAEEFADKTCFDPGIGHKI